jgi:hypothetical protein
MIRIETDKHWLLLTHQAHAQLAGEFARHWKNSHFLPPEPFVSVLDAVSRHDDSWQARDAEPELTDEGNPSAFSRELVGSYDAFEEIDLDGYLKVRGQATGQAASRDPYAAVLISMHTVNLLTEQADLSSLDARGQALHRAFIEGQLARQAELKAIIREQPDLAPLATDAHFDRGFRFLQACDSFSLYVGVAYDRPGQLRHPQALRGGGEARIALTPLSPGHYSLDPWPMDETVVTFQLPYRSVAKHATRSLDAFREAYRNAAVEYHSVTISPAKS